MILIRSLISALIVALIAVSAFGVSWWNDPPEAVAAYRAGGQAILVLLMLSGALGLWQLWSAPERPNGSAD